MRIAIITGASSDIGKALAAAIDKACTFDEIWLAARHIEMLKAAAPTFWNKVRPIRIDLLQRSERIRFREMLAQEQPDIELLVNAAGSTISGSFAEGDLQDVMDTVELNTKALIALCHYSLPYMKSGSGIINIGSGISIGSGINNIGSGINIGPGAARQSGPYQAVHAAVQAAGKAMVYSFSRALGRELKPKGIHVMCVSPDRNRTGIRISPGTAKNQRTTRFERITNPAYTTSTSEYTCRTAPGLEAACAAEQILKDYRKKRTVSGKERKPMNLKKTAILGTMLCLLTGMLAVNTYAETTALNTEEQYEELYIEENPEEASEATFGGLTVSTPEEASEATSGGLMVSTPEEAIEETIAATPGDSNEATPGDSTPGGITTDSDASFPDSIIEIDTDDDLLLQADATLTLELDVKYEQSAARSMLQSINSFRTGSEAWYWNSSNTARIGCSGLRTLTYDYDLEKVAMMRAVEIAVSFSHTRPNGGRCFSAYAEKGYDYGTAGENIAAGYESAAAVFEGWKEANEYYSGQGHRRNMLDSDFDRIGIGCVYYNGQFYWVQEFSGEAAGSTIATTPNNSNAKAQVKILSSKITSIEEVTTSGSVTIEVGRSANLPSAYAEIEVAGHWPSVCMPVTYVASWSLRDKTVATISGNRITGVKAGSTTATRSILGQSVTVTVKAASRVVMFRLYNSHTGEHFYTASQSEKEQLVKVGWKDEGVGWIAPKTSKTPVYRLYNANVGEHHYTRYKSERDALVKAGWKDEGIGWYSDDAQGVPLYRQYNPNATTGTHNYTTSKSERDALIRAGWRDEGIGWYGLK